MENPVLPHLEIGSSREDAELSVLLMHGLGANGYDFADVAEMLCRAAAPRRWRFVLPHAPEQPVTINGGIRMPAWYDILDLEHPRSVNWDTVFANQTQIEALMDSETADKFVLAGFSQGAAMALHSGLRHQERIAGILMMSGYFLVSDGHPCPEKAAEFPIGMFHGSADPMVPFDAAEQSVAALAEAGFAPTLVAYPGVEHSVCEEEIRDVFAWLSEI